MIGPLLLWVGVAVAGPPSAEVGLLGEGVTHPGAYGALEAPVVQAPRLSLGLGGRVGAYHHVRHHTGLVATVQLAGRARTASGWFVDAVTGLGLRHRVLAGPVYRPTDDGLQQGLDAGRPQALSTWALGLGIALSPGADRPMELVLRSEGWLAGPLNRRIAAGGALTVGVAWVPGGDP